MKYQVLFSLKYIYKYLRMSSATILNDLALSIKTSVDNILKYFCYFSQEKHWHFMQIVSTADSLLEMSISVFSEKKNQKIIQYVVC